MCKLVTISIIIVIVFNCVYIYDICKIKNIGIKFIRLLNIGGKCYVGTSILSYNKCMWVYSILQ